jgi:hypothetical protein
MGSDDSGITYVDGNGMLQRGVPLKPAMHINDSTYIDGHGMVQQLKPDMYGAKGIRACCCHDNSMRDLISTCM